MERLTTDPSPPSAVRRRDVVGFVWHAGAEKQRRQREADMAIRLGDMATLARLYREAEFQHALALWMIEESQGGALTTAPPLPPVAPPPAPRRRSLWARLWAALWG